MNEFCVCCGAVIPEGRQVCISCESRVCDPCEECKELIREPSGQKYCRQMPGIAVTKYTIQLCPRKRYAP